MKEQKNDIFIYGLYSLTIILIILLPRLLFGQPVERKFSFEESIKFALLNNREILMAKEDIEITNEKANEALSFRYPQVDVTVNYSRYQTQSPYYLNPTHFGNFLLREKYDELYGGRISLNQLLYAGRRAQNTKKSSNISMRRVKSDYEKIRHEVIFKTKTQFYAYQLETKRALFISKTSALIEQAKKRWCNNEKDIEETNRYLEELRDILHETQFKQESARLEFLDTIGIDLNTTIETEEQIQLQKEINYDAQKCIARALQLRPELLKSQAQEELGMLEMNISLAERTPIIMLGAGYQYSANIMGLDPNYWFSDWDVGISINIPLFDGGAWFARNRQKRTSLRKSTIKRVSVEEKIKKEIEKSFIRYKFKKQKLEIILLRTKNLAECEKTIKKQAQNQITRWDLWFQKTKQCITQRLKLWQTMFDYNMSVITLNFLIGEP